MRIWKHLAAAIILLLASSLPALAICDISFGGTRGNIVADNIADLCNKNAYPNGATPVTATNTGTTASIAATLAAVAGKTTYICGFSIRATATAGASGNATVAGLAGGTLNFTQWAGPVASAQGVLEPNLGLVCLPASAANTTIVITSAAPGTGGVISIAAWGYQL